MHATSPLLCDFLHFVIIRIGDEQKWWNSCWISPALRFLQIFNPNILPVARFSQTPNTRISGLFISFIFSHNNPQIILTHILIY